MRSALAGAFDGVRLAPALARVLDTVAGLLVDMVDGVRHVVGTALRHDGNGQQRQTKFPLPIALVIRLSSVRHLGLLLCISKHRRT